MDDTGKDEESLPNEIPPDGPAPTPTPEDGPANPVTIGLDRDGFFVVRIDTKACSYHEVQGHLLEATHWLRSRMILQQRHEQEAADAKKILPPTKGPRTFAGRFRLFK